MADSPMSGFKNIFTGGPESDKIIKSGSLFVTRGAGAIAIGLLGIFYGLDQVQEGPWQNLNTEQKLSFVVAVGFIWAIIAAADALARGISTGLTASREQLLVFDPALKGELEVEDDQTAPVKVRAVRLTPGDNTKIAAYLVSYERDGKTIWRTEGVKFSEA